MSEENELWAHTPLVVIVASIPLPTRFARRFCKRIIFVDFVCKSTESCNKDPKDEKKFGGYDRGEPSSDVFVYDYEDEEWDNIVQVKI